MDNTPKSNQTAAIITFALYSVAYEAIIWGIFGWAVFARGHSGWWVAVALMLSGSQLKPRHFGIIEGTKTE